MRATLLFFMAIGHFAGAQITGLWEIKQVTAGPEAMTPTAKWTRINVDGTFQSGNGWMQNAEGSWTFDENTSLFSPVTRNWIADDGGPFKVHFSDGQMRWQRTENGSKVEVTLVRISELPKHPADKVLGLWDLTTAKKGEMDIMSEIDPDDNIYMLVRWDRIFVKENTLDGRLTGFWHMNGHRPELTLMYHQEGPEDEKYQIGFRENELVLTGSDSTFSFTRIDRIPN